MDATHRRAYRRERDAIDAEASEDWRFAREGLAARRAARAKRAEAAQSALDEALATLLPPHADAPRDAAPGELALAIVPAGDAWIGDRVD